MKQIFYLISFFVIFQISSAFAEVDPRATPETASGFNTSPVAYGEKIMMVTANPLATRAGYEILEQGGSAADAAFAAQLVLGLVEPQSSGLGGGAFALYWDAEKKKLFSYDGRETAPASAHEKMFLVKGNKPQDFFRASVGGKAVGVPGVPKLLEALYLEHGTKTPWSDIFQPALELSEFGFIASPRLVKLVKDNKEHFRYFKSAKEYFLRDGYPIDPNQNIKNLDYHTVLKSFKDDGSDVFYTGDIAVGIKNTVNQAWYNPGNLTMKDLETYEVKVRDPVCGPYRHYRVCSMGEPSSGGLTLIQILGMIDRFDLEEMSPTDPEAWHIISEASRLAFADRNLYMADPDFVETPGKALIDPLYLAVRSSLISEKQTRSNVTAGIPKGWKESNLAMDRSQETAGTTHIIAVDQYGDVLSMTSSIETAFGAKMMSNGFLLNNQLTDFSFLPEDKEGREIANRVEPGKRPRSSMSPVIVFDEKDQPVLVIGSAGGSRIIGYVLQRIIAVLDWNMPVDEALAMPHVLARGKKLEVEEREDLSLDLETLLAKGHEIDLKEMNSGLTAAVFIEGQWQGVADPRREGIALGK